MKNIKVIKQKGNCKHIELCEYVHSNYKEIICLIAFFVLGVIIGVICINNANENDIADLSQSINEIDILTDKQEDLNNGELFYKSVSHNVLTVIAIWLIGCMIIGIPLIFAVITYKGFCLRICNIEYYGSS